MLDGALAHGLLAGLLLVAGGGGTIAGLGLQLEGIGHSEIPRNGPMIAPRARGCLADLLLLLLAAL